MRSYDLHSNNHSSYTKERKIASDVHAYIFEENYRQLLHLLNFYTFNPEAPHHEQPHHRQDAHQLFLLEIARLASNYFFAAKALNQHLALINAEVPALLKHPVGYFVKDLQTFILNHALPIICENAIKPHLRPDDHPAIYFDKSVLLAWSHWHEKSIAFLNDQDDYFEILDVINLYATLTLDAQMHFLDTAHNV
jgi:hypothetical protein